MLRLATVAIDRSGSIFELQVLADGGTDILDVGTFQSDGRIAYSAGPKDTTGAELLQLVSVAGAAGIFWKEGGTWNRDETLASTVTHYQPFPPYDIDWSQDRALARLPASTDGQALSTIGVQSVASDVLPQFMRPWPVDGTILYSYALGLFPVVVAGLSQRDGQAGSVSYSDAGSFPTFTLPGKNWIRSALLSDDLKQIWLSVTSLEPEAAASRPTIYFSNDAGTTFAALSETVAPPPGAFISFAASLLFAFVGVAAFNRSQQVAAAEKAEQAQASISDAPIGIKGVDVLGLRNRAIALSKVIRNIATAPPVAFGIVGPWGSGKSSLMSMLREDLESRSHNVVWFNAWHHQDGDHILASLFEMVRQQAVPALLTFPGIVFRLQLAWRRKQQIFNLVSVTIIAALVLAGLLWLVPREWIALKYELPIDKDLATALGSLIAGGLVAAPALAALVTIFKPFQYAPDFLTSKARGLFGLASLSEKLSVRDQFQDQFEDVTEVMVANGEPLVLIIDDLDRCSPETTKIVLDAVSFLTSAGKCFVVVGYDRERVMALLAQSLPKSDGVAPPKDEKVGAAKAPARRSKASAAGADPKADANAGASAPARATDTIAERYMRKIINVELKVPTLERLNANALLEAIDGSGATPRPASDPAQAQREADYLKDYHEREQRKRRMSVLYSILGIALFAAGTLAAILAVIGIVSLIGSLQPQPPMAEPAAEAAIEASAGTETVAPPAVAIDPATGIDLTAVDFSQFPSTPAVDILPPEGLPLFVFVSLGIIVAVGLVALVVDLLRRNERTRNLVEDTSVFHDAARSWLSTARLRDGTPRNVKQFINTARLQAQIIERHAVPEGDIVALCALDWLDPAIVDALASDPVSSAIQTGLRKRFVGLGPDELPPDVLPAQQSAKHYRKLV